VYRKILGKGIQTTFFTCKEHDSRFVSYSVEKIHNKCKIFPANNFAIKIINICLASTLRLGGGLVRHSDYEGFFHVVHTFWATNWKNVHPANKLMSKITAKCC
jgi:hypothetical protein